MGASVIAGRDAPLVLEFSEHILDPVALFLEDCVVFNLTFSVFPWGNTGLNPLALQGFPEPIGVIATICEKVFGRWQGIDNQPGALVIAHLPF
jgi:hypothetical protein